MSDDHKKMLTECLPVLVGDYYEFKEVVIAESRGGEVFSQEKIKEISDIVAHINKIYSDFL